MSEIPFPHEWWYGVIISIIKEASKQIVKNIDYNSLLTSFKILYRVQETDGSYFESFTALAWKRENRRMSAVRAIETRAETLPENERQLNQQGNKADDDVLERPDEKENLYMEVLQTIANTVGAPAPGGQVMLILIFLLSFLIYEIASAGIFWDLIVICYHIKYGVLPLVLCWTNFDLKSNFRLLDVHLFE